MKLLASVWGIVILLVIVVCVAVSTGKERLTLKGHMGWVTSVAYSPDGKTLASGSGEIKLWDIATGKEQATLKGHTFSVKSVAFSPDGKTLVSGSEDKTIKLWDVPAASQADK
jgi:WD40 repeat protein